MATLMLFRRQLVKFSASRCCSVRQFHHDEVVPIGTPVERDSPDFQVKFVVLIVACKASSNLTVFANFDFFWPLPFISFEVILMQLQISIKACGYNSCQELKTLLYIGRKGPQMLSLSQRSPLS